MFSWQPIDAAEFEALHQLRLAAMRDSLLTVGRYDPIRSRERFARRFFVDSTRWILWQGRAVGFAAMQHQDDCCHLDHLYVVPEMQGQGVGSHAMLLLQQEAAMHSKAIVLCALRDSPSNRFYQKHGFVKTHEEEWDIWYRWKS
ncbi:GNAT family N-acetyltransferase [Vogesella oryzae]|uniref:GNAT family N-acetyltransferase n=1 Tax=Vogesella oryzae TaxID=1735285 RepID=UPI001582AEA2|nr:GNAT family N-acetyltransferase [Vogesella oryzae]